VIEQWDEKYQFLEEKDTACQLAALVKARNYRKDFLSMCRRHAAAGKAYYESIFWASMLLNNGLAIMPSMNMINNVGFGSGTHYSAELETMPKTLRQQFTMQRFEMEFPLKHPKYVIDHVAYQERLYKRNAWNHPVQKTKYALEELFANLRRGNFSKIGTCRQEPHPHYIGQNVMLMTAATDVLKIIYLQEGIQRCPYPVENAL